MKTVDTQTKRHRQTHVIHTHLPCLCLRVLFVFNLDQICFTTEIVTSGTLKQYVHRVRNVKLKVIKKWCRQILTALDYLHIHSPPIIHR